MPKSIDGVIIPSHGSKMLGTFWQADTVGRHPTVLLLHGIPGTEKQTDLAYALREAGWNCLAFHYRGCWGSEGNYCLANLLDDVEAALDFLANDSGVDMERLAGVGLSLGGWAVINAAARGSRLKAVVSLSPLVDSQAQPLDAVTFAEWAAILHGITPEEIKQQWLALPSAVLAAPKLADRPTLLLTAEADTLFPPSHIQPLAAAMPFAEWIQVPQADHVFSGQRPWVVKTVLDWLTRAFSSLQPFPEGYTLRHPTEADHLRVIGVLSDWWGGRDLSHLLPRLYFQHFNDTSFIVEHNGELVAFLIGFLSQSEVGQAYIHFVGVHPEHRKHHLGQALYERFFQLARARGATEVHAITGTVNSGSQAYHARLGFVVSPPIPDYDGPGDDRVTMTRRL
jgi:pimeloyl-ACP methyl ester carboxylesterase/GNAT superfamily N-acetyltransferase